MTTGNIGLLILAKSLHSIEEYLFLPSPEITILTEHVAKMGSSLTFLLAVTTFKKTFYYNEILKALDE